jgi:hypothetical protein
MDARAGALRQLQSQKCYFTSLLFFCDSMRPYLEQPPSADGRDFYGAFLTCSGHSDQHTEVLKHTPESLVLLCQDAHFMANSFSRDVLIYSFLPSYFRFFLVKESFALFLEFLELFSDCRRKSEAMQILFLTPHFATFVHESFYPVVQRLLSERIAVIENTDDFFKRCESGWLQNLSRCPRYVKAFLDFLGRDACRTMYDCFFKPFFAAPHRWGGCDGWCRVPAHFFSKVMDDLKYRVMRRFVEPIRECGELLDSFISEESRAETECAWEGLFVSNIDLAVLRREDVKRFDTFSMILVTEPLEGVMSEEALKTQALNDQMQYDLRQLLKNGPYLPQDEKVDPNMKKLKIVKRYLVNRAPLQDRPRQIQLFQQLTRSFDEDIIAGLPSTDALQLWFRQGAHFLHEEPMGHLVKARRLQAGLAHLAGQTADAIRSLEAHLRFEMLRRQTVVNEPTPPSGNDVFLRPELFHDLLRRRIDLYKDIVNRWGGVDYAMPDLDFHIMAENVRFRRFRRLNPHLRSADLLISACVLRHKGLWVASKKTKPYCRDAIENIGSFAHLGERFKRIFSEDCDALTKLLGITRLEQDLTRFYSVRFIGKEADADDMGDLRPEFISRFFPPHFCSAIAFMSDFVTGIENEKEVLFTRFYRPLAGILQTLSKLRQIAEMFLQGAYPGETVYDLRPPWALSRYATRHRSMDLFVQPDDDLWLGVFSVLTDTQRITLADGEFSWFLPHDSVIAFQIKVNPTEEAIKRDVALAFYKPTDFDSAIARWFSGRVAANRAAICVCVCESAVSKAISEAVKPVFGKRPPLVIVSRTDHSAEEVAEAVKGAVGAGLWRLLNP